MHVEHPIRSLVQLALHHAPVEAQLVVTRRCNLSCGYCSEANHSSAPVALVDLRRRIDAIHRLRAVSIALLGGEPLLHPDIVDVVEYAHRHSQVSITTNGYLLTQELVERLNTSGLSHLQISIDALDRQPGSYIQKTFDRLESKLDLLCRQALFATHVTIVLCSETVDSFKEFLLLLHKYPVKVSVNVVHDASGASTIQGSRYVDAWRTHFRTSRVFSRFEEEYGALLLSGHAPAWHCRAGERSLYVDEFGEVHFCSAQRRRIRLTIDDYTPDVAKHYGTLAKGCERGCSIFCAYRASLVDNERLLAAKQLIRSWVEG